MAFDAKAYMDRAERGLYGETHAEWRERTSGGGGSSNDRPNATGGQCGDCGGTGDCIHCDQGFYPRRDGTKALCGKCHARGTRRNPYRCHACRGKGYGGHRCGTPTYQETLERLKREEQSRNARRNRALVQGAASAVMGYRQKRGAFCPSARV
jgi:hypothetical protein